MDNCPDDGMASRNIGPGVFLHLLLLLLDLVLVMGVLCDRGVGNVDNASALAIMAAICFRILVWL